MEKYVVKEKFPIYEIFQKTKIRLENSVENTLEESSFSLSNEVQRARLVRLAEKVQFFDAVALPEKDVPILLTCHRSSCHTPLEWGRSALRIILRPED